MTQDKNLSRELKNMGHFFITVCFWIGEDLNIEFRHLSCHSTQKGIYMTCRQIMDIPLNRSVDFLTLRFIRKKRMSLLLFPRNNTFLYFHNRKSYLWAQRWMNLFAVEYNTFTSHTELLFRWWMATIVWWLVL